MLYTAQLYRLESGKRIYLKVTFKICHVHVDLHRREDDALQYQIISSLPKEIVYSPLECDLCRIEYKNHMNQIIPSLL